MHKLHYRIKNILPCKTGRILLVFNPIVPRYFYRNCIFNLKRQCNFFGCYKYFENKLYLYFT